MRKHIIFSILTLIGVLFLFLTRFNGMDHFSFWLYKNSKIISWIQILYISFYFVYFLKYIFQNIYKIKLDKSISIILLAFLSTIIWLIEILLNGWEGLIWLKYKHIAFYIIFCFFLCWLVFINKKNGLKNIVYKLVVYGLIYLFFMLIFIDTFYALFNPFKSNLVHILVFKLNMAFIFNYILVFFIQILFIFIFNIIIAKIEKQRINVILILSTILIIPFTAIALLFILTHLFSLPIYSLHFDPIHWLKSGSIIFGLIIYECSYIAYLNKS
jgi:hypothetical protein